MFPRWNPRHTLWSWETEPTDRPTAWSSHPGELAKTLSDPRCQPQVSDPSFPGFAPPPTQDQPEKPNMPPDPSHGTPVSVCQAA